MWKNTIVKIAVQNETIYIQTGEAKERKLDLLKTTPMQTLLDSAHQASREDA
jgi:hypothetical protein